MQGRPSRGSQPKDSAPNPKEKTDVLQWLMDNKLKTAIGMAAAALAVTVGLLVSVLAPTVKQVADSMVISSGAVPTASLAAPKEEETPFDPTRFVGTVLPETEHAGLAYAEETLFLGDSNTVRMMSYYDVTGVTLENGFGVVGMGINSFTTLGVAQFEGTAGVLTMPEIVKLLQPRRVVMTFGTNNVGMYIDNFIEHYKKALDAVKKAYPYADVIIGAIFPVDQYRQNTNITMANINKMNVALVELARQEDVKFLNWFEPLHDEENGHSKFEVTLQDGVHLTRAGMQAIFDYFCTHSFVTEDIRPKPLKPVPKRVGVQPGLIKADPKKVAGPIDWSKIAQKDDAGQMVHVNFAAWDETNGTAGGGTVSAGSLSAAPGGTTAGVTATPAEGYTFAGWNLSAGASGSTGSATISVFIDPSVAPGTTLTATAIFRKTQATPPAVAPSPGGEESQPGSTPSGGGEESQPGSSTFGGSEDPPSGNSDLPGGNEETQPGGTEKPPGEPGVL